LPIGATSRRMASRPSRLPQRSQNFAVSFNKNQADVRYREAIERGFDATEARPASHLGVNRSSLSSIKTGQIVQSKLGPIRDVRVQDPVLPRILESEFHRP
jgi:hypothetical protein